MATVKTAYTPEQSVEIIEAYKINPTPETVEAMAVKFGKTVKSVIAKLSREGVYKKKEYKTKNGDSPVSKESLADQIGMLLNMNEADISSLTKANKTALNIIAEFVKANQLSKPEVI